MPINTYPTEEEKNQQNCTSQKGHQSNETHPHRINSQIKQENHGRH